MNPSILASLFDFITALVKACHNPKTEAKPSDFTALLQSLAGLIPSCGNQPQLVLRVVAYLLETADLVCPDVFNGLSKEYQVIALFVMKNFKSNMNFGIDILQNCLKACPKIFISDAVLDVFVGFMINNLNISAIKVSGDTDSPVKIFSIYSDLIKQLQSDKTSSSLMTSEKYFLLFDPLRVLPVNDTHSTSRLYTWWIFLCFLQEGMLSSGTNRYLTPFLANLIGRYISVNESLGNRFTTRYTLSPVSVYSGSSAAQNLAMHVFACLFNYPELGPAEDLEAEQLPKLTLSSLFLAEKGYTLLVALLHWLRYLCGNDICIGGQKPSEIWAKCLWLIRRAVSETLSNVGPPFVCISEDITEISIGSNTLVLLKANMKGDFLADCVVKLSVTLISPQSLSTEDPCNMIAVPGGDKSSNPDPSDCLHIINEVYDILASEHVSSDFKAPLYHELCLSCLQLISFYHEKYSSCDTFYGAITDIMRGLGEGAVESFRLDYRVVSTRSGVDRIALLHSLITALSPDCSSMVARLRTKLDTLEAIEPSHALVTMNTAVVNEVGLNVWSVMADCLIKLALQHENLTDREDDNVTQKCNDPNLTTMYSFLLTPIFLSGNTKDSPSPSVESEVLRSMFNLFRAFRQEALSLTTISINSSISKLSMYILALIQNRGNEVKQSLNLRIIANFLSFMVESADLSEDILQDKTVLSPSQWESEKGRLLGYMLGPVEAISRCLTFMPLENAEMSISNAVISFSSQEQASRSRSPLPLLTSLSTVLSPSAIFEKVFLEFGQLHRQAPKSPQSVTCNLLHSLWLILRRNKYTKKNIFELIDRCSFGLLSLSKRLESFKPGSGTDESHASIVSAYEAFVTMAWNWILKNFNKPCVVDDVHILKKLEMEPLTLPKDLVRKLVVFFEAAVRLASCPVSSLTYRIGLVSGTSVASTPLYREIPADRVADISRRHKLFIYCLVSLWDTLVASTVDDTEVQTSVASATARLAECLTKLSVPRISLRCRATSQPWVFELLIGRSGQDPSCIDLDNSVPQRDGPENSHVDISSEALKTSEVELCSAMSIIIESLGLINNLLFQQVNMRSGEETLTDEDESVSQISSSQASTDSPSKRGSRASSRKPLLPTQKTFQPSRKRLSLPSSSSQSQSPSESTVNTCGLASAKLPTEGSGLRNPSATLPPENENQPRPFPNLGGTNIRSASPAARKVVESAGRSRKRQTSDGTNLEPPTNRIDFEDSSDFVFIPPSNTPSAKRMRLTEHQKDRKREQRQAYIPPLFNSLDRDSSDTVWALYPSDSQSSIDSAQSNSRQAFDSVTSVPIQCQPEASDSNSNAPLAEPRPETNVPSMLHVLEADANSSGAGFEEESPVRLDLEGIESSSERTTSRKGVVIHSLLLPDNDITNPNAISKTRLIDVSASPSMPASPMVSASPMMSPPRPLPRSPGLNNSRTLKILQNSRAEIEKKQKLRLAELASMGGNPTLPTTPISSPARTGGILRDSSSNQNKHVSFADQATVIVIDDSPFEDEQPTSPKSIANISPLRIETGSSGNLQDARVVLSPLVTRRSEAKAASPAFSPSSAAASDGTRRRKSTSPKRNASARSSSRLMTRRQNVTDSQGSPFTRKRVFALLESKVDSKSLRTKRAILARFTNNDSSSPKLPKSDSAAVSSIVEAPRATDVEIVEETEMIQESAATSGNLVDTQNSEVIEATQEIPEIIDGKPANVLNDTGDSEKNESSAPDFIEDTPLENVDEQNVNLEIQERPEQTDMPITETESERTTSESQDTAIQDTSKGVNEEEVHLDRIRQAFRTIGEELRSLTRERRRDAVVEIIGFLHPFCSS
ncbi:hypothetical protein Aperf_G00000066156 [Anoplocephala perfoliata]